jgi:hypothetical protein
MVADEFGAELKFVHFRLFTCEFVLLDGLKFVLFREKGRHSAQFQIRPVSCKRSLEVQ